MAKKRVRNRAARTKKNVSKPARKKTRTQRRKKTTKTKTAVQETPTVLPRSRSITIAAGAGIDLITAGEIVQAAIPGGPHDIDSTLENAGLITDNQRLIFRADVVENVSARGCTIDEDDVPNSAATTLRAARTAVQQNAH